VTVPAVAIRPRARWILPQAASPEVVSALQDALNLPEVACQLLAIRGHTAGEAAKRYLRPRLEHIEQGGLLDLDVAIERLMAAAKRGETVLVHGDYDVDGMTSTTILVRTLESIGAKPVPFIPRRATDGYDLTAAGVNAAKAAAASLVVTCDCGTSAIAPVKELRASGIDVIIIDHHLPTGEIAAPNALLNPKRPGCPSVDKDLCAAGVVFKLALALMRSAGGNENLVYNMLDLVALATIADIAPLRGENRVLARYGLKLLNDQPCLGLRALIRSAGLEGKPITAGRVGFVIAPRLNAVGRLGHALRGVELLLAKDEHTANGIARELEELNVQRQEIDRQTLVDARKRVLEMDLDSTYGIVVAEQGWHAGVIGIVASRIVEEFGRPTVLVALVGGEGKGSGRSISPFDLHAGLSECRDLFKRFGGHRSAAGVTIAADRVDDFARRFNEVAASRLTPEDLMPEIRVDLQAPLADANERLESIFRHLEPCGMGNPSPVMMVRGATVVGLPRVVGKDGLKVVFRQGEDAITAVGWGLAHRREDIRESESYDVAFKLERDEYRGVTRLQARLVDFRPCHHERSEGSAFPAQADASLRSS
jgi:single-stranded-DNA-specific exonuclease